MSSPTTPRVVVLFLHGMGETSPTFASDTIHALRRRLRKAGVAPRTVIQRSVLWNAVLKPWKSAYLATARQTHSLDWFGVRGWLVHTLGDAASYQRTPLYPVEASCPETLQSPYERVHATIDAALRRIRRTDPLLIDAPLLIAAHSLGAQVLSNYLWDRMRPDARLHPNSWAEWSRTPLERLETLAGIVTFGSPLPLFLMGIRWLDQIPFPSPWVTDRFGIEARWVNLYDRDDPLGWPMRPLGGDFTAIIEDREITLQGLAGQTPWSHGAYWADPAVVEVLAERVLALLAAQATPIGRPRSGCRGPYPGEEGGAP